MSKTPKKLFAVRIEVTAMVAADDQDAAIEYARDNTAEIFMYATPEHMALDGSRIHRAAQLPAGWGELHHPFNATGARRIGDYLKETE